MNKTIATAARAMTICVAVTLGFNAAVASAGSPSNDPSVTDASLTYIVSFPDLDLSKIEGAATLYGTVQAGVQPAVRGSTAQLVGEAVPRVRRLALLRELAGIGQTWLTPSASKRAFSPG